MNAEVSGRSSLLGGTAVWEKTGFGGFIGATWDINAGQQAKSDGLMMSFKIHFVDLGSVDGQELLPPLALSPAASRLNRGFYQLQLGYHRR